MVASGVGDGMWIFYGLFVILSHHKDNYQFDEVNLVDLFQLLTSKSLMLSDTRDLGGNYQVYRSFSCIQNQRGNVREIL